MCIRSYYCYTRSVDGVILEQAVYDEDDQLVGYHLSPALKRQLLLSREMHVLTQTLQELLTFRHASGKKLIHKSIANQIGKAVI